MRTPGGPRRLGALGGKHRVPSGRQQPRRCRSLVNEAGSATADGLGNCVSLTQRDCRGGDLVTGNPGRYFSVLKRRDRRRHGSRGGALRRCRGGAGGDGVVDRLWFETGWAAATFPQPLGRHPRRSSTSRETYPRSTRRRRRPSHRDRSRTDSRHPVLPHVGPQRRASVFGRALTVLRGWRPRQLIRSSASGGPTCTDRSGGRRNQRHSATPPSRPPHSLGHASQLPNGVACGSATGFMRPTRHRILW
jgi:hypothetical protein